MSKLQRRSLKLLLQLRDRPPTVLRLLWLNRGVYGLNALCFGIMALYFYAVAGWTAVGYVGVAFAAVLLRDLGWLRRTAAVWPLNRAIIDWEKAARLDADASAALPPLP